jgi:hypothetical protein
MSPRHQGNASEFRGDGKVLRVLVLEGAGAFMPLTRAAEGFAFRRGHFLTEKKKPAAKALSHWTLVSRA